MLRLATVVRRAARLLPRLLGGMYRLGATTFRPAALLFGVLRLLAAPGLPLVVIAPAGDMARLLAAPALPLRVVTSALHVILLAAPGPAFDMRASALHMLSIPASALLVPCPAFHMVIAPASRLVVIGAAFQMPGLASPVPGIDL